ncbi:MAG TPA: helix-hairpin-helix domain-containing protein [Phycisphaerales bacterium]|nr:helix-hairpin-helix domain-containing protein [Phycisphaerales bacterium]
MPSDSDKAWERMTGTAAPPAGPKRPASTRTPPLAGAAKWGAVAVLGAVAVFAIGWVLLTSRTRPAITRPGTPASASQPDAAREPGNPGSLLDINTATAAQLEHLPGIGPAIASRIVADRAKHGPYLTVEQLDRVDGIGPKTIQKLRPYIAVK